MNLKAVALAKNDLSFVMLILKYALLALLKYYLQQTMFYVFKTNVNIK